MVWGVSNVWVTYSITYEYMLQTRDAYSVIDHVLQNPLVYEIWEKELEKRLSPETVYQYTRFHNDLPQSFKSLSIAEYNEKIIADLIAFSDNNKLFNVLWIYYKVNASPQNRNMKWIKTCNRLMRLYPNFKEYAKHEFDISTYRLM